MPLTAPISILLLAAVALSPFAESPREAVRCSEIAFSRAAERGDAEGFAALIDPQARFLGAGVLEGPEEVTAAWRSFFEEDGPRIAWRPRIVEVLGDGSLALTRGPYRIRERGKDGEWRERWGTFTSVWRRGQDGWRVVFDAGGDAALEPDPAQRALLAEPTGCPGE